MEGCRELKGIGRVRMGVVGWLPEVPAGMEAGWEEEEEEEEEEVPSLRQMFPLGTFRQMERKILGDHKPKRCERKRASSIVGNAGLFRLAPIGRSKPIRSEVLQPQNRRGQTGG